METYCGLALSGQRSDRYPGLCVQAVGSGLCGQRLRARDESALEVAPPDRRLDRRPTAFTTMRYTNRQPFTLKISHNFQFAITMLTMARQRFVAIGLPYCVQPTSESTIGYLSNSWASYVSLGYRDMGHS